MTANSLWRRWLTVLLRWVTLVVRLMLPAVTIVLAPDMTVLVTFFTLENALCNLAGTVRPGQCTWVRPVMRLVRLFTCLRDVVTCSVLTTMCRLEVMGVRRVTRLK